MSLAQFQIDIYLAVLMRIGGLFVFAPFFNNRGIPLYAKVGVSALLAAFVLMGAPPESLLGPNRDGVPQEIISYFILIIREGMIGFVFGTLLTALFAGVQAGGASNWLPNGF